MSSFLDLVDAVGAYYGTGSDQWNTIAQGGINSPEALDIIRQVPGVNVTTSNSGQILGYDFDNAFPGSTPASSVINSNTQTGAFNNGFSSNIPANAVPPSTDVPNGGMSSGAKLTGTGATIASVADKVSLAVAGVALGTKLGKMIDAGIYALNPNWFDEHYPTINPETWDDMATTEGGKQFVRSIFGLQNDSATMYVDERLLAQTYMMLKQAGAYSSGGAESSYDETIQNKLSRTYTPNPMPSGNVYRVQCRLSLTYPNGYTFVVGDNTAPIYTVAFAQTGTSYGTYGNTYKYIAVSEQPFKGGSTWGNLETAEPSLSENARNTTTLISGKTFYYWYGGVSSEGNYPDYLPQVFSTRYDSGGDICRDIGTIIFDGVTTTTGSLDGVTDNPNATTFIDPSLITGDNLEDVLNQLKTNYPSLFDNSIYNDVPQPDGSTQHITYIPVPYPNGANTSQPTTDTTPDINPQINPEVNPSNRPNAANDVATEVTSPVNNAPDTGTGTSPTTPAPTGGASSLWAVYNPTQAQVDDFGAWLWSSDFVEQIKKMFSDPMQGIIGLHKIFATPATGAAQNIKVGYLDSGVPSAVVTSQYTDVDCGAVNVAEYFGNVFDYEDTNIRLYLPFIGIVDLSTSDVMRGNVRVMYHVDVITGACLADVIVSRDSAGGVLYQYSGDAAVRYPVSSGSYMGMVNGVLAIAGAVVGVASGGAALPAVMGAVGGIMNSHTDVKHSGSFSGAAGAMGAKIPYLIIERPQTAIANDFASYQGIGDNRVVNIGSLAGYFKMTDVHTDGVVNASEQEIEQIKALLEGGVIQ